MCVFNRGRAPPSPQFSVYGLTVPITPTIKILGIMFDRSLSFKFHISTTIMKIKGILSRVLASLGRDYGLNARNAITIYESLILTIINYGFYLWANRKYPIYIEKRILSIQRAFCLAALRAFPSTAGCVLDAILNLTPLDLYLKLKAEIALTRICGSSSNLNIAITRPPRAPHLPYPPTCPCIVYQRWDSSLTSVYSNIIFVDGSARMGCGGCGIVYFNNSTISHSTSLFIPFTISSAEAEALAIYTAIQNVTSSQINSPTLIVSDSKTALDQLSRLSPNIPCIVNIIHTLASSSSNQLISFSWAGKSLGLEGLRLADSLARSATPNNSSIIRPRPSIFTAVSILRSEMRILWEESYEKDRVGAYFKRIFPSIASVRASSAFASLNHISRNIIAIVTGYSNLRAHLHLIGRHISPMCRFCAREPETFRHLIFHCPPCRRDARSLLDSLPPNSLSNFPDIPLLLSNRATITRLNDFINSLNITI